MALLGLTLTDLLGGGGTTATPTVASASALTGRAATNLGPLTTTFTPPAACTTAVAACSSCLSALLGQTCDAGAPADAASCWPPITSGAAASPSAPFHGLGFYSPGVICPAGYASACSATAGGSTGWPMEFSLGASETAVGCCPNGYACGNESGQTCVQVATSASIHTVACGAGGTTGSAGVQVVPQAAVTAYTLFAPMIQINFQSSDLAAGAKAPATTTKPPNTLQTSTTANSSATQTSLMTAITAPPTTISSSPSDTLETDGGSAPSMAGASNMGLAPPMATTPAASDSSNSDPSLATSAGGTTSSPGTMSTPVRVAAAVGGGVGALALIIGAIVLNRRLWRERRNRRRADSMVMSLNDYDPQRPGGGFLFNEADRRRGRGQPSAGRDKWAVGYGYRL